LIVRVTEGAVIRFGFLEPSYLLAAGFVLLCTFVSVGSDLGLQAPVMLIGLVWALHLAVGLASIRLGVISLSRWSATARWPDLALLSLAGLFASIVLAPVSLVSDQWLLARGIDTDDEFLFTKEYGLSGIPEGLIEEWTNVVGPALLVAVMLGLPSWWARREVAREPTLAPPTSAPTTSPSDDFTPDTSNKDRSCLQRLPAALGTDLIAARSELQYVRIYTTKGDALILGALKDVAEQRQSDGQIVHRSWWVSHQYVRMLRRRGTRYVLILVNGLEVPVSRRRQQAMIRQFGASTTLNS
jgi:hypothetical protein